MNKGKHTRYPKYRANKIDTFSVCDNVVNYIRERIYPEKKESVTHDWVLSKLALLRRYYEAELKAKKNGGEPTIHYGRNKPSNWHRTRELTPIEREIYHYITTHPDLQYITHSGKKKQYSVSTTYRLFLATRCPETIKKLYIAGKINQTEAIKRSKQWYARQSTAEGEEILEMVAGIVERMACKMEQAGDQVIGELNGMFGTEGGEF